MSTVKQFFRRRPTAVALGAVLVLAVAAVAVFAYGVVQYATTPERVCVEGHQPVWEPATGTSECQAVGATLRPGWEVVRVGADRHVPLTLDDPDLREWERTVRPPVTDQQTTPAS